MKERPILFSAPMVRSLLNCTKSQTRRVVKAPGWNPSDYKDVKVGISNNPKLGLQAFFHNVEAGFWMGTPFPYGQPGDRLWVREAWRACRDLDGIKPRDIAPGGSSIEYEATSRSYAEIGLVGKLRPSMFMPRWASRINLEITGVRVERLNDISEEDARAEGAKPYLLPVNPSREQLRHVDGYTSLWNYINGVGSWEENPWVWVVEFRRIES